LPRIEQGATGREAQTQPLCPDQRKLIRRAEAIVSIFYRYHSNYFFIASLLVEGMGSG